MQAEPPLPRHAPTQRPTLDEVRLALVRLHGRSALIRHRIQRTPKPNQVALLASLDAIERQIQVLTELLDAFEDASDL